MHGTYVYTDFTVEIINIFSKELGKALPLNFDLILANSLFILLISASLLLPVKDNKKLVKTQ